MPDHVVPSDATALLVGQFRFYFADESWEWSAAAAQIHGYPAAAMRPTTEQVMLHKHPHDHAKIAATLAEIRRTHGPVNTRHRIVDVQGQTHEIIVVGERLRDEAGRVVGNQGFYVDVTPTGRSSEAVEDAQRLITAAVAGIAERRAVIEQVKGILMFVYRIDAERAFNLLTWRSQVTNTKMRELASQYLAEFNAMDYDEVLPTRLVADQLLLTAHKRIKPPIAS
jgi:ANTAR domain-containing protein/PAS domain-containing protein